MRTRTVSAAIESDHCVSLARRWAACGALRYALYLFRYGAVPIQVRSVTSSSLGRIGSFCSLLGLSMTGVNLDNIVLKQQHESGALTQSDSGI